MLNAREPKIVNGPQILDKYVGESEANVRKLFAEADEEEKRVTSQISPVRIERRLFLSLDPIVVCTLLSSMKSTLSVKLVVLWYVDTTFEKQLSLRIIVGEWCWCSRYCCESTFVENRRC